MFLRRCCVSMLVCAFAVTAVDLSSVRSAYASELTLPVPTQMVQVSQTFSYPVLKGLKIDPQNPLNLEFIIDTQDKTAVNEAESQKLVNYFLAAVAVPQKDLWVNLSPYEKDRVVTDELGQTVLGEELLAQDYLLKQLSSSLTDPNTDLGKSYWNKVASTGSATGSAETLKKIWIKPSLAEVYEKGTQVFVTKATLDVESEASASSATELLLPAIRKEVNEGEHFAPIRQAYYSIILGLWFKEKLRSSIFKDYIDAKHVNGIAQSAAQSKEEIFNAYVESFKKGVYNQTAKTRENGKLVKRSYFSGGFSVVPQGCSALIVRQASSSSAVQFENKSVEKLTVRIAASDSAVTPVDVDPATWLEFERMIPPSFSQYNIHSQHVSSMARFLAKKMGLSTIAQDLASKVGLLHDVGTMTFPGMDDAHYRSVRNDLVLDWTRVNALQERIVRAQRIRYATRAFEPWDLCDEKLVEEDGVVTLSFGGKQAWLEGKDDMAALTREKVHHGWAAAPKLQADGYHLSNAEILLLENHTLGLNGIADHVWDDVARSASISGDELMSLMDILVAADVLDNTINESLRAWKETNPNQYIAVAFDYLSLKNMNNSRVKDLINDLLMSGDKDFKDLISVVRRGDPLRQTTNIISTKEQWADILSRRGERQRFRVNIGGSIQELDIFLPVNVDIDGRVEHVRFVSDIDKTITPSGKVSFGSPFNDLFLRSAALRRRGADISFELITGSPFRYLTPSRFSPGGAVKISQGISIVERIAEPLVKIMHDSGFDDFLPFIDLKTVSAAEHAHYDGVLGRYVLDQSARYQFDDAEYLVAVKSVLISLIKAAAIDEQERRGLKSRLDALRIIADNADAAALFSEIKSKLGVDVWAFNSEFNVVFDTSHFLHSADELLMILRSEAAKYPSLEARFVSGGNNFLKVAMNNKAGEISWDPAKAYIATGDASVDTMLWSDGVDNRFSFWVGEHRLGAAFPDVVVVRDDLGDKPRYDLGTAAIWSSVVDAMEQGNTWRSVKLLNGAYSIDDISRALDVSASSVVEGGVDLKKMTVKSAAGSSAIELSTAGIDPTMFKGGLSFTIISLQKVPSETVLAGLR